LLSEAGISHDFVGSQTAGSGDMADPQHEGYGGKNTGEISERASPHFSNVDAHLYLIHVGTNDVSEFREMDGRLRHLLDQIYAATPEATVILAKIINRSDGGRLMELDSIRAGIEPVVTDYRARQCSIHWVDQNHLGPQDFPPGDVFHPNDSGYRKMAAVWFEGIVSAYSVTARQAVD
jgi:lysophospholipase L1-like esterase